MLKKNYFNNKIESNLKSNRTLLAEREFITIKKLSSFVGYKINNNVENSFLDLGCGDKHLEKPVVNDNFKYIGLDINDLNFETDDFPLENNSIDIVVGLAVIEHLMNPDKFMQECYRVLKPGGLIFISTPNIQYSIKVFYDDPTHVRPYSPYSLKSLFKMFNFKQVDVYPGLRCKPKWYYMGKYRFFKARWLLPFRGDKKYVPQFLKGKSLGIFALGIK